MPIPSPVHGPMETRCTSKYWKEWAGYHAVRSFDICHEREYFALRHAAGVIDVSPLFKYEVRGKDAAAFLSLVMVKDIRKLKLGQVTYLGWCDEEGYLLDDGTVSYIADNHYRVTAAEPSLAWFDKHRSGFDVELEDSSEAYAALSVQGPYSRDILNLVVDFDLEDLKFFRVQEGQIAQCKGWVSRTGYTGDLGYEVWVDAKDGPQTYEAILNAGAPYGIKPCGLDAMDVTRIEAGFIMNGVDYYSANHCMIDARKVTPYEIGLGWCVQLDREPFIGQQGLRKAKPHPRRNFVGIEVDWLALEAEFSKHDLPPEVPAAAWRDGRPLYNFNGKFIGQATSGTWSPTLKKYVALGQVDPEYARPGTEINFEITVEYERVPIRATVVKTPFFNPERKRK